MIKSRSWDCNSMPAARIKSQLKVDSMNSSNLLFQIWYFGRIEINGLKLELSLVGSSPLHFVCAAICSLDLFNSDKPNYSQRITTISIAVSFLHLHNLVLSTLLLVRMLTIKLASAKIKVLSRSQPLMLLSVHRGKSNTCYISSFPCSSRWV